MAERGADGRGADGRTAPAAAPAAAAARRRDVVLERMLAEFGVLLAILVWWLTARDMPAFVLPGPLEVAARLGSFATDTRLMGHFAISAARVLAAVGLAMAIALALALLARRSALFDLVLEKRILLILNSFPSVGWAILGIIWFQVSNTTVIFIETLIVLPFCLINTLAGFRQLDAELDEMGRSLTRSRWRRFTLVTVPLIMPFVVAGLRIAYGICWKIALVAELFGARSGLGFLLMQAQASADAAMVFAICLLIVLAFFAVDRLVFVPLARRYSINKGAA